jgi:uncharacterized repeat protein (TIGR01451 family)
MRSSLSSRATLAAAILLTASAAAWGQQNGNGLYAEYYNNATLTAPTVLTEENEGPIDFDYVAGTPDPLVTNVDAFSTRWRGQIEGPATAIVTFNILTSDVGRVFINGTQVVNTATSPNGNFPMVAGQRYDIAVEHLETTGNAQIRLSWSWPAAPNVVVVPKNRFYSPTGGSVVPAAVVVTPNGGEVTPPLLVDLTGPAAGVPIYFTLDGSDPGVNSPFGNPQAHLFTIPFSVSGYVKINARAYNLGVPGPLTTSNQFSPRYPVFAPIPSTGGGLYRRLYQYTGTLGNAMPNWEASIPVQRRIETLPFNGVDSTTDTTSAIGNRGGINDNFACRFSGYINMADSGLWTFQLNSDDDSRVFIDGVLVVHATATNVDTNGQIALDAGMHSIVVDYYDGTGGNRIFLRYQGPNVPAFTVIPAARFFTEFVAPTPIMDVDTPTPNPFTGSANLILRIPGGVGTIYYTTDGTAPDPRSATGSGSDGLTIPLTATTRVRALTVQSGVHPSAMYDVTFIDNEVVPGSPFTSTFSSGIATQVEVLFNRTVVGGADVSGNYTITAAGAPAVTAAARALRNPDLKAWWKLDDAGPAVDDSGANNVDGTHVVTPGPDAADKAALDFTNLSSLSLQAADGDYVTVPHNAALDFGTRDFTLALWVNPAGTAEYPLISKWNQATPKGWALSVNQGAAGNVTFRTHDGTNDEVHTVAGGVAAGWQHIAVRFDRVSLRTTIFRNGAPVGAVRDMTLAYSNSDTTAALELGRLVAATTTQLDGKLDDVRVYGVALSNAEILGLFNGAEDPSARVLLTTGAALNTTTTYTLNVAGLTDATGGAVAGSTPFIHRTGFLLHEQYNGGTDVTVVDLTRLAIYPNSPSVRTTVTSGTIDLDLDNYGGRLRGYFIPNQTGRWRFAIASDDNGQLWLSTDSDPTRKVLVSTCTPWTNALQFGQPEVVQSAPITLTSGQRYYIEALYKEVGGGDHCTIAAKYIEADPTVTIANNEASIATALISPSLLPAAGITTQPFSKEIQAGGNVTFTVAASGGLGTLTYQWKLNDVNITNGGRIAGATTTTLTITGAVDVTDEGTYTVSVTNSMGTVTSLPATLVIRAVPAPSVASITPVSGPTWGGGPVIINGSNFLFGQTTVAIGATTLTGLLVYFPGDSMILAYAPASVVAGAQDVVGSHLGQSNTLVGGYSYNGPPVVVSLSSTAGTNEGGELVTISGSGFLPGPTSVKFGSLDATNVSVAPDGLSLTCNVPGPALGTVNVTVITSVLPGAKFNAYTYYNDPTIAGATPVSPAFGTDAGGQTVTITGMNFAPLQTSVTFGGTPATLVNVAADGLSLTCVTPLRNGVTSKLDVAVVVTTPGGATTLNPLYTYYADPTIGTISPNNGPDGGSQIVTISGSGFSPDTAVSFGGTPGTLINVISDSSLEITTPLRAGVSTSLTVAVAITAAGGTVSNPTGYTYWADPTVSGVLNLDNAAYLNNGRATGGNNVRIDGTNFGAATAVTFDGQPAQSFSIVSPIRIDCVSPIGSGLGRAVQVSTPGGNASGVWNYHDAPTLTSVAPNPGTTQGGVVVTLTGSNMPGSGLTGVTFGGVAGTSVTGAGGTATATTPAHAAGDVNVVVTTPGGQAILNNGYTYAGPFVSGISPNVGPLGGDQSVTISGSGLTGTTDVTIGGNPATNIAVVNDTTVTASTPLAVSAGTVAVVVTTGAGSFTLPSSYTYVGNPSISSVTPNQGPTGGAQAVRILGADFASGFTTVTIGGNPVSGLTFTGTNQLDFLTPAGTPGLTNVVVTTFATPPSATAPYTYSSPTTASAILPKRGPLTGAQTVTITGTNFVDGNTQVSFGAVAADPASITVNGTGTSLTVVTPPGAAAGAVTVSVRTFNDASQQSQLVNAYTYVNAATAIDLELSMLVSNAAAGVGQNITFTITLNNIGQAAGSGVVVTDLLPAELTYVSHVQSVGAYLPGTGVWTVGNIAATNGSATLTIVATVNSSASFQNIAEVTAAAQEDMDSVPNNGSTTPPEDDRVTANLASSLTITNSASLPDGTARAFYSTTLTVTGGTGPYTWALTSGTLPFNLDPATGVISGFAPNVAGPAATDFVFTIQVTDSSLTPETDTLQLTISIDPMNGAAPVINPAPAAPNGVVGQVYTHAFTATGGAPPYVWSSTALPAGLFLNPNTGVLAGVPTTAGAAPLFTVTATSPGIGASTPLGVNITIAANPITFLTPAALPNATQNALYTQYVEVTGGVGPFTWTVSAGALPTWPMTMTASGRRVTLSGTPNNTTAASFTLRVADGGQGGAAFTRAFTFSVAATGAPIAVTPTVFPVGTLSTPYTATLTGTGGNGSYFWTITGGSLPTGVNLTNPAGGLISGTPSAAGTFSFTAQAAQFGGGVTPGTATLTITIAPAPTLTTPLTLPGAAQGVPYFADLSNAGGAAPVAWTVAGGSTLPTGLALDPTTGVLSGTPTVNSATPFTFTLTATDANGAAVSGTFSLTVANPAALVVVSTTLPRGQVGVPYSGAVFAAGGTSPYTWSTGALPPGLTFTPSTGAISGTPLAPSSTVLTFQVTDNVAATANSGNITLNIDDILTITTTTLPLAGVSSPYGATLSATGGAGLVWQLTSGSLPAGMTLSPSGTLGGTLTATAVTSSFQVSVTDSIGRVDSQAYTITVGPAILPPSGGGSSGGGGCGGSIGLATMPFGALTSLAALLALATRRRRKV